MSVELATAYISCQPSMKGVKQDLTKQMGGPAEAAGKDVGKRAGKGLGSAMVKAAAPLLGAAALFKGFQFAKDAVGEFAELEDASAAAGVTFGKSYGIIEKEAGRANKTLGLSKSQYTNAAITFGTFGKAAGKSGKDLAGFSTEMVTTAADMASFRGTTPEEAIEAVGAALRGESEPIRKYGVLLDDATLRNRALKMGLIETTKDALSPQNKALAAQAEILAQTKDAQGDFQRTSESTANVAKIQAAEFQNLQATIGAKLAPAFTFVRGKAILLMRAFSTFLGEMERGEGLGGRFASVLQNVGETAQNVGGWIKEHKDAIFAVAAAYAGFQIGMFVGNLIASAIAWARDTAAVVANTAAKVGSKVQTLALVAMYTGQWIAAQARSIAGWVRETAVVIAHKVALAGVAAARKVGLLLSFIATNVRSTAMWIAQTAAIVANRVASTAVAIAHRAVRAALIIAAAAQWAYNAALSANPIGLVIVAVAALVAGLVWFFTKTEAGQWVVRKAWAGIKAGIKGVSEWWTGTAWPAIRTAVAAMVTGFNNAKAKVVGAWNSIKSGAGAAWKWINQWVIVPFKVGVQVLAAVFQTQKNLMLARFAGLKAGLKATYQWVKDNVFARFKSAIMAVKDTFDSAVRLIKVAWNKIKGVAAAPINFVINTVYMQGIRAVWNKIAENIPGLDLKLPKVSPIKMKTGGVLPGYTPGRDVHRFTSPTGGNLDLSGGEAIMVPEWTKAVGGPAGVAAMNSAAKAGRAFKNGGVFDFLGDAGDWLKDKASIVAKVVSDPGAAIRGALKGVMGKIPGGGGFISDVAKSIPKQAISALIEKIKSISFGGGNGVNLSGGGVPLATNGMGWQNMWNIVKNAFPGATLNSAFRPGAITAVGTRSMHGLGRAIDVSPSMAIFNWIAKNFPNANELIYSPAGGRQLYRGQRMSFGEPTKSDHYDHVHWSMKNGGIIPPYAGVFDHGGVVPPGRSVVDNRTGGNETLYNSNDVHNAMNNGPLVGTMVTADPRQAIYELEAMKRRAAVRAGLKGRG